MRFPTFYFLTSYFKRGFLCLIYFQHHGESAK